MDAIRESLRVLFDAAWLRSGPPSGRSVLRGLINGWAEEFPSDTIALRIPGFNGSTWETAAGKQIAVESGRDRIPNHGLSVMTSRPMKRNYDVYVSQNFGTFFGDALKCVFLHDGIYKDHPEWFSLRERIYLGAIRPSLQTTDLIFTSSHSEAERVERLWPKLTEKVRPIGLGLPDWVYGPASRPAADPTQGRPYILTVGRLNVRKNLDRLISAFTSSHARSTHDLVIVGEPDGVTTVYGQNAGVHFMRSVTDSELKYLYSGAAAFVFPSLDEGFGLPLIEAGYFGLNVAASDIPVFRELGVADHYFDPTSIDDIRRSLDELVPRRQQEERRAFSPDSWKTVAFRMREETLLHHFNRSRASAS